MTAQDGFTLAPRDEFPIQAPPGVEGWTENYFFQGYDPGNRIGFFHSLGSTHYDPRIWRELVTLYLPDGTLLLAKGFGHWNTADLKEGPRGASLAFTCDEPFERWRVRWSPIRVSCCWTSRRRGWRRWWSRN